MAPSIHSLSWYDCSRYLILQTLSHERINTKAYHNPHVLDRAPSSDERQTHASSVRIGRGQACCGVQDMAER